MAAQALSGGCWDELGHQPSAVPICTSFACTFQCRACVIAVEPILPILPNSQKFRSAGMRFMSPP
jgi:hypothetical protein